MKALHFCLLFFVLITESISYGGTCSSFCAYKDFTLGASSPPELTVTYPAKSLAECSLLLHTHSGSAASFHSVRRTCRVRSPSQPVGGLMSDMDSIVISACNVDVDLSPLSKPKEDTISWKVESARLDIVELDPRG